MIGGRTLIGQIATFIDSLHLSYHEVMDMIPYRVLVIMSKDRMHEAYGEVVHRISGKELAQQRRNK
jgi:hypothetical protein